MPGAALSIREATAADADAIVGCLQAAFEPYRKSYSRQAYLDTTLTPETVHSRLASMSILVAVTEKREVVGTISFQVTGQSEGHLRGMAVLPGWQGAGIAEKLLKAAERELRARHCSRVSLDTTDPLRRAIRFYEKHGFHSTGRVSDFFGMPLFEYVKVITP